MYEQLLQEGARGILLKLLAAKFGSVPESVRVRVIEGATPDLERWAINVLTASTLDAVFSAQATPGAAPSSTRKNAPAS